MQRRVSLRQSRVGTLLMPVSKNSDWLLDCWAICALIGAQIPRLTLIAKNTEISHVSILTLWLQPLFVRNLFFRQQLRSIQRSFLASRHLLLITLSARRIRCCTMFCTNASGIHHHNGPGWNLQASMVIWLVNEGGYAFCIPALMHSSCRSLQH